MTWNQAPGVLKREAATQGPDLEADDHGGIAESVRLTEIVLAGFWREALGLKEVDLHDDFFELGGDSARALQVIKSINQSFVLDLSVSELIQNPTIEKLATVCDRETYGKPDPKLIQLAPGRDEGTLYIMDVRAGLCRLGQRLGDSGLAILGTMTPLAMFHPG
ncbi:MAG TPA: phosphopantetheine-binding protein, partial [Candidatus Methylacidiphilales bacterium]